MMIGPNYVLHKVKVLAKRANRHKIVGRCRVGDTIGLKGPDDEDYEDYVCIKVTSNGFKRFRGVDTGKIETYEPSHMKECEKAYDIMQQIDDVLKENGY